MLPNLTSGLLSSASRLTLDLVAKMEARQLPVRRDANGTKIIPVTNVRITIGDER